MGLVHRAVCLFTPQHLHLRRDGQAELTWVAGYVPRWFIRLPTFTHPSTNQWCVLDDLDSSSRPLEDKEHWPWPWSQVLGQNVNSNKFYLLLTFARTAPDSVFILWLTSSRLNATNAYHNSRTHSLTAWFVNDTLQTAVWSLIIIFSLSDLLHIVYWTF